MVNLSSKSNLDGSGNSIFLSSRQVELIHLLLSHFAMSKNVNSSVHLK